MSLKNLMRVNLEKNPIKNLPKGILNFGKRGNIINGVKLVIQPIIVGSVIGLMN